MPIINVDLDGVVDDFHAAMDNWFWPYPQWTEIEFNHQECPQWNVWEFIGISKGEWYDQFRRGVQQGPIWETDPCIDGARSSLWELSDRGFDIRIVTTRLVHKFGHNITIKKTADWLEKNAIPYRTICFLGPHESKTDFASHYAIDDNPDNLDPSKPGSLLFSRPWNIERRDFDLIRVKDWNEATRRILLAEQSQMGTLK